MIHSDHNHGHVGQLLSGERSNAFCGWSVHLLTLAMLAYSAGDDFLFVEQDCLVFGDFLGQAWKDMGDGSVVFGHRHPSEPWMEASNSLVLIRHEYIPTFVSDYIAAGDDRAPERVPETKFAILERRRPQHYRRLSFGVDRCRPIPWDNLPFYAQKLTDEELAEAERRGLL